MRCIGIIFIIFLVTELKAGEIALNRIPEPAKSDYRTPLSESSALELCLPLNSTAFALQDNVSISSSPYIPPVELGFFCLFELRLEKKFKFPVNFELK